MPRPDGSREEPLPPPSALWNSASNQCNSLLFLFCLDFIRIRCVWCEHYTSRWMRTKAINCNPKHMSKCQIDKPSLSNWFLAMGMKGRLFFLLPVSQCVFDYVYSRPSVHCATPLTGLFFTVVSHPWWRRFSKGTINLSDVKFSFKPRTTCVACTLNSGAAATVVLSARDSPR